MPALAPFKLERYFALYEFKAPYLLSASDCESLSMAETLAMADAEMRALWDELSLGYTESAGHPLLREEISRLYTATGPEDVLEVVPEEGIFLAMHALLTPGDEVIALTPAYQSLLEVARSIGALVRPWPLRQEGTGWRLDLDLLRSLLSAKTRLLVVNFPHNPTGFLPERGELEAIVTIARQRGLVVFCDEMYRLLEYDPAQRLPAMCDLYERGVSLSGMSKTFAMPGLRAGWLAARDRDLHERLTRFKDYTTICGSAPSEILALIGLRARDQIIGRNLKIITSNLAQAGAFFARRADRFTWLPPRAGSVAFPAWTGPSSVETLADRLVEDQGVMLVPGSLFDAPGQHFRLGLGRRNFSEALARLDAFLGE